MVTIDDVALLVRRELRGRSADTALTAETELKDLGLSSLQVSEVVFSLEDKLQIEFDTTRAAEVKSLGDVVRLANEAVVNANAPLHS